MEKLSEKVGECPYCGGEDLEYNNTEMDEDVKYYCTCKSCKRQFIEVFNLEFVGNWGEEVNKK